MHHVVTHNQPLFCGHIYIHIGVTERKKQSTLRVISIKETNGGKPALPLQFKPLLPMTKMKMMALLLRLLLTLPLDS